MFALAGRLAPLIGKAAVKAVTKGGQMIGANPQITRDVAANAARSARQAVRGLEGAEALGTAVATTMSTGDPLRGVQAGVANVAGNIGVNMGLNGIASNTSIPKGIREAAQSDMAKFLASQAVAGAAMASTQRSPAATTISPDQHAQTLQAMKMQAALDESAQIRDALIERQRLTADIVNNNPMSTLQGMTGVGMPATTDYSYLQPR